MTETVYRMIDVEGHAPQTEHVDTEHWAATCTCGYRGPDRDSAREASEDRFAHEAEIGMRVEAAPDE